MSLKDMSKTQRAMHLHVQISNAISAWGMANARNGVVLDGQELVWTVAAACALELSLSARSSGLPITHVINVVKEVVSRPDAVKYIDSIYRNSVEQPTGVKQ